LQKLLKDEKWGEFLDLVSEVEHKCEQKNKIGEITYPSSFTPVFPQVSFDETVKVKSYAFNDDYICNLTKRTCSCNEYQTRAKYYNVDDHIRMVCRHQYQAIKRKGLVPEMDRVTKLIAENTIYRSDHYHMSNFNGVQLIVGFNDDFESVTLILEDYLGKGPETFYLYLTEGGWWHREKKPTPYAMQIKKHVKHLFGMKKK